MNTTEQRRNAPTAQPAPPHFWTERAFEAGWVALVLACAAEGVCRLLWAG